jgi:hypothetical protein
MLTTTLALEHADLVTGFGRANQSGIRMAEERSGAIEERDQGAATVGRQRTLWAMVGIQFVNTMAFSVLTPIMPLFLPVLGVETARAIDLWSGILNGVTRFVAAFASPRGDGSPTAAAAN